MKKKRPELRFSGFDNDWEQRKLSELVTKYENPVETPHDGYTRLGIRSHGKGTFHEYVEPGHELETAQMHRVAADKLIFNITFAWEHAVAITTEADVGRLVSHRFPQFTLSDLLRPEFLKYVILDEEFHHNLYLASPGGAGRNRVLKTNEALDYLISFPSVEEQHKIGECLNSLNNLITLHRCECTKLICIKKSMLENMFPQKGEKIPRIRFSGFTDDWEQRKLLDVAPLQRGFDLPASQMKEGKYPVVMSNGIGGYHSEYKVKGPGIITGRSGTIGKLHYIEENYWPHNTALWVTDFKGNYSKFIFHLYRMIDLSHYETGSGVPTLNRNDVHDAKVFVPRVEEQRCVAVLLDSLDHLITLHQRKLGKLQNIKKAMLEKMFV